MLAYNIVSKNVLYYLELSKNYGIVDLIAGGKMSNKSLVELNIRAKYGVNIMAIKREGVTNVSPHGTDKIQSGDIVYVIGAVVYINKLENALFDNE